MEKWLLLQWTYNYAKLSTVRNYAMFVNISHIWMNTSDYKVFKIVE